MKNQKPFYRIRVHEERIFLLLDILMHQCYVLMHENNSQNKRKLAEKG
jgi:hypothetical protein